jgi:hypothetical protein
MESRRTVLEVTSATSIRCRKALAFSKLPRGMSDGRPRTSVLEISASSFGILENNLAKATNPEENYMLNQFAKSGSVIAGIAITTMRGGSVKQAVNESLTVPLGPSVEAE